MLKLENINITFNKNTANERKALQHIDLDVADGDFVTVIGSNGAGKSTLMNVISGSYEADTGKIFLDGKNITHLKEHQRARTIGRLFQDPLRGTAPNMTIEENLGLAYSRGKRRSLTTLMITHNISNAIEYGNKTIVMSQGKLLLAIEGEQRANMTVEKLMKLYSDTAEDELSDKMILQE